MNHGSIAKMKWNKGQSETKWKRENKELRSTQIYKGCLIWNMMVICGHAQVCVCVHFWCVRWGWPILALTWMLKTEGMVRTFATKTCLSGCVQIRHVLMIPYASHAPEPQLVAGQPVIIASIPDVWPCLARNQVNVLAESGKLPQSNSGRLNLSDCFPNWFIHRQK